MGEQLRVGYRRLPDGSAEPICEPTVDAFLIPLWRRASEAVIHGPHCVVIGSTDGALRIEGTMRPNDLFASVGLMVFEGLVMMQRVQGVIEATYPFATIAETVVSLAGPELRMNLDRPFVETAPPTIVDETAGVGVDPPRIETAGGRLRVIVTGNPANHPVRAWADAFIRDRVRDAILERFLREHVADGD